MKVCIIGCGNMGLIYAQLLIKSGVNSKNISLIVKNETKKMELMSRHIGNVALLDSQLIYEADLVLISVKPQDFNKLTLSLRNKIKPNALVISIMAGINTSFIQKNLRHENVIRAMPNAPALFGKGVTVYFNSENISEELATLGETFLSLTGKTLKTQKEELLDAVTAISGSGPAYFFYLAELINEAAESLGIDKQMANILVRETLIGSAEMVANSNQNFSSLIDTVASKGGTTEAALNYFRENHTNQIISNGLAKASEKSKDLSKNLLENAVLL